jgi:hypothetical protein
MTAAGWVIPNAELFINAVTNELTYDNAAAIAIGIGYRQYIATA